MSTKPEQLVLYLAILDGLSGFASEARTFVYFALRPFISRYRL